MSTPVYSPLHADKAISSRTSWYSLIGKLTEVVTLPFAVHVAEKEDTENDGDHVELGEDQAEKVISQIFTAHSGRLARCDMGMRELT